MRPGDVKAAPPMSFTDRMYGVTQEEEGVSKVLSVNLVNRHTETPEEAELTAA